MAKADHRRGPATESSEVRRRKLEAAAEKKHRRNLARWKASRGKEAAQVCRERGSAATGGNEETRGEGLEVLWNGANAEKGMKMNCSALIWREEEMGRKPPGRGGSLLGPPRGTQILAHDSIGGPRALSPHPELKYHVEDLDFMLHETQKELDNCRVYINQTRAYLAQQTDTIRILSHERKTLRQQCAKKDATIARFRAKIVSLEATVKAQEDQLMELAEEGEEQGGAAF
ncbi:hypothetical protein QYE76_049561 [Lolium multiflorum]|uniref:Uncharacterized protein n=1 Tax=Lolium multiflorum TaxID=4521 RepID=A0AAD8WG63_LOLMU|nr:hypothetical protein QYE76_049561 [Lolium multiflorum]